MNPSSKMRKLVDHLVNYKVISSQKVYNTMLKVDRAEFCSQNPYEDSP